MEADPPHLPHDPLLVVAAVFVRSGTVLACRRGPGRSAAGRWEFPGGKIESGEAPEQALQREVAEELSITATVGRLLDRTRTPVGSVIIDLSCYLIDQYSPVPTASTDHDRLRWQPIAELADLDWALPDLPAVRRIRGGVFNT